MLRVFDTASPSISTAVQNSALCQPCAAFFDGEGACDKLKNRIVQEFLVEVRFYSLSRVPVLLLVCDATNPVSATCGQAACDAAYRRCVYSALCALFSPGAACSFSAACLKGPRTAYSLPRPYIECICCLQVPLLKERWKTFVVCLLFQYVHGLFGQFVYRRHVPQDVPLKDTGFDLLPVRSFQMLSWHVDVRSAVPSAEQGCFLQCQLAHLPGHPISCYCKTLRMDSTQPRCRCCVCRRLDRRSSGSVR